MNNLSIRKNNELSKKKKKGFTLVELIIVIAIIAILAAMAIPKLSAVRVDAKVSNDVAAAKNIQTQIATEIANGTIPVPTATTTVASTDILSKLDGKNFVSTNTTGAAEADTALVFNYTVDKNGDIHVLVGTDELYPDNDGKGRIAYAKDAKDAK